jgi:hypothetical protein
MGYSQIANPILLRRKRTMPLAQAYIVMGKHLAANLIRSLNPEHWCHRRGRLAGNFMALRDFLRGKLHPSNILSPESSGIARGMAPQASRILLEDRRARLAEKFQDAV